MLLTIDVGNTQTVVGLFDLSAGMPDTDEGLAARGLVDHWRLSTVAERTADEVGLLLDQLLTIAGHLRSAVEGVAVASVVPRATESVIEMARRYFNTEPVVAQPATATVAIKYDDPNEVGADRLVNALAAHALFGGPALVVDFGTAVTFDAVAADGSYVGGAIVPGLQISTEALFTKAAALRKVELRVPPQVIATNTSDAVRSGVLFGFAAQVDGLCRRMQDEQLGEAVVIATGGMAPLIAPLTHEVDHTEPWLTLYGLRLLYDRSN